VPTPPDVGATAPEFTLPDETGREVSLSQLAIGNGLVLVFYRGLWCPFCLTQLAEYRDLLRISRPGIPEIVALSVDTPGRSAQLKADLALPFRLLCDPQKRVLSAWGLLSPEKGGIAFNATFGLDRRRTVVFRSLDTMVNRASGEAAIQAVLHPQPAAPQKRKVFPSLTSWFRGVRYALKHGLGAPRA